MNENVLVHCNISFAIENAFDEKNFGSKFVALGLKTVKWEEGSDDRYTSECIKALNVSTFVNV